MKLILILVITVLICLNFFISESDAKQKMKKSDEIRCTNNYEKFMLMGSENFQKRYYAYPLLDKCLILYKDSDFIKKYSSENIKSIAHPTQSHSKILTSFKIGPDKFLTKFNICFESNLKTNHILIVSDKEKVVGTALRTPIVTCPSFWVVIYANDLSNTKFTWSYDNMSNLIIERKML